MNNLSNYQRKVLFEIYSKNLYLATNEGANYKCWLEDKTGFKSININRRTAEILSSEGYIIPLENDYGSRNISRYVLSEKSLRYLKKMKISYT